MRTYEGQALPASQIAVLELPLFVWDTRVTILEVDGKPIGPKTLGKVELTPGSHQIKAWSEVSSYGYTTYYSPVTLELQAEAGHIYIIKEGRLLDKSTGQVFGSFGP